jgi:hypothetical protein
MQDGVQNQEIRQADIAALTRQAVFDLLVSGYCDSHCQAPVIFITEA